MAGKLSGIESFLHELATQNNRGRMSIDSVNVGARVSAGQLHPSWLEPDTMAKVSTTQAEQGEVYELKYNVTVLPTQRRLASRTSSNHLRLEEGENGVQLVLYTVDQEHLPDSALPQPGPSVIIVEHARRWLPREISPLDIQTNIKDLMATFAPLQSSAEFGR